MRVYLHVVFVYLYIVTASMGAADWNSVKAKFEEIVSYWRNAAQEMINDTVDEDFNTERLIDEEQILTAFLAIEILSKLAKLNDIVNETYDPKQAMRVVENKKKLEKIFANRPVIKQDKHEKRSERPSATVRFSRKNRLSYMRYDLIVDGHLRT